MIRSSLQLASDRPGRFPNRTDDFARNSRDGTLKPGVSMLTKRELFSGSIIFSTALAVVLLPNVERADAAKAAWQSDQSVPAHHTQPPAQPLPDTMSPERFDNPVVKNAYAAAGKV